MKGSSRLEGCRDSQWLTGSFNPLADSSDIGEV